MKTLLHVGILVCAMMILRDVNAFNIGKLIKVCPAYACLPCSYGKAIIDERGCDTCKCSQPIDPCLGVKCPKGKHCEAKTAKCICSQWCPLYHRPVCGSDINTYGNICRLNVHNCLTGNKVKKIADGPCCYLQNWKTICIAKK